MTLINREDAIEAVARDIPFITFTEDYKRTAQRIIGTVPSAEPKTGKWIEGELYIRCSECGYPAGHLSDNYCPNCGADMRGDKRNDHNY